MWPPDALSQCSVRTPAAARPKDAPSAAPRHPAPVGNERRSDQLATTIIGTATEIPSAMHDRSLATLPMSPKAAEDPGANQTSPWTTHSAGTPISSSLIQATGPPRPL